MNAARFYGSITALITTFKDDKIDTKAYQDFVKWQLDEGTNGLVPCGTTGESSTLSDEEGELVINLRPMAGRIERIPLQSFQVSHALRIT